MYSCDALQAGKQKGGRCGGLLSARLCLLIRSRETLTHSGSLSQAPESLGQGRVWREAQVKEVSF